MWVVAVYRNGGGGGDGGGVGPFIVLVLSWLRTSSLFEKKKSLVEKLKRKTYLELRSQLVNLVIKLVIEVC